MMEHTKEPWATDYRKRPDGMCAQEIFDTATGETIANMSWFPIRDGQVTSTNREENASRIVACVNACAGMEDPETAIPMHYETIKIQAKKLQEKDDEKEKIQAQRDELLAALGKVLDMHKRRAAGFPIDHEIEVSTEEYAENLISEIILDTPPKQA